MHYLRFLLFVFLTLCHSCLFADQKTTFLVLSDIHLNTRTQHPMSFAPKSQTVRNDLDVTTFKQLIDTLHTQIDSRQIESPAFILVLGDIAGHIRHSQQDVIDSERIVFTTLKEAFPDIPVLYVFGNNDSFTGDYGLFRTNNSKDRYRSPLDLMKELWGREQFISGGVLCKKQLQYPCLISSNTSEGYYSAYLQPKLRLIALNSVMFSEKQSVYFNLALNEQIQWLKQQLEEVNTSREKALLVMHIPPGNNIYKAYFWSDTAFWSYDVSQKFYALITQYHMSILGILAAHTHKDEIKLVQHSTDVPLNAVYLNPAMSTSHGNAPAIRLYDVSEDTQHSSWDLTDYQSYYFTKSADQTIHLELLYRFQGVYCSKTQGRSMQECWDEISFEKMQQYLGAGNANFQEKIAAPENIYIK